MRKLNKKQLTVLEHALNTLYAFLREKFNVKYTGYIFCVVYKDIVRITQCSTQDNIAWFVDIALKERKMHIITREVEGDTPYIECEYTLLYMSSQPTTHTVSF